MTEQPKASGPHRTAEPELPRVNRRRRFLGVVTLFTRLMSSFLWSYGRARLTTGAYDFYADSVRNRRRARWIRAAALDMGGVIIKVGQFLSTRVDLLPDEYIEELSLLQDEVPPVPFDQIEAVLVRSFGRPVAAVFSWIDKTALAAASLGQVHRARLWGGQSVAVKVKRPGIEEIVEADLAALRFVVNRLNRWRTIRRRVDLPGILREFTVTLREELDYVAEAHNAERIAVMFEDEPRVVVPRVYWSHVRRDVITLEYVPGIKITDYGAIERAGISRSDLAEILLQSYLHQIIDEGFFHADPHPGNVFARPGPVIVLVDFGMVGRLTPRMRQNLRDVFLGVVARDFNRVVRALVRLRFIRPAADLAAIRRAVMWTVDTFYEMSFAELRDVDPRDVLDQTYDVFRAESFQIPTNFAYLGRAVGTLAGLCTGLDPSFQFNSVATPYARRLVAGEAALSSTLQDAARTVQRLAATAVALPGLTQNILEGIGDPEWIRRDLNNVSRAIVRVERMVRALLVGLLATAFLISAAFLAKSHAVLAVVALIVTALLILRVVVFMVTSRRGL